MKIERMNKGEWGKVKAFFDVRTEEGFVIKGFKILTIVPKNPEKSSEYVQKHIEYLQNYEH